MTTPPTGCTCPLEMHHETQLKCCDDFFFFTELASHFFTWRKHPDIYVSALQFYVPVKWNSKECLAGTCIQTTNALIAKLVWTEMRFVKSSALPVGASLHVCKYTVSSRNCCDGPALLFAVVADSCSTHCLTHWKIKGVLPRNEKLGGTVLFTSVLRFNGEPPQRSDSCITQARLYPSCHLTQG